MIVKAKYVHTNLVARDWKKLAGFYEDVFGCVPVPPERNLSGKELEAGTGIPGAHIEGIHLRLPGTVDGPTLEIFSYDAVRESSKAVNGAGFAHIAFLVENVEEARSFVLSSGGSVVGEVVTIPVEGKGRVTFCYIRDPEGNVVELQSWSD